MNDEKRALGCRTRSAARSSCLNLRQGPLSARAASTCESNCLWVEPASCASVLAVFRPPKLHSLVEYADFEVDDLDLPWKDIIGLRGEATNWPR